MVVTEEQVHRLKQVVVDPVTNQPQQVLHKEILEEMETARQVAAAGEQPAEDREVLQVVLVLVVPEQQQVLQEVQ